jgi:hypothetical protein
VSIIYLSLVIFRRNKEASNFSKCLLIQIYLLFNYALALLYSLNNRRESRFDLRDQLLHTLLVKVMLLCPNLLYLEEVLRGKDLSIFTSV